MTDYPYHVADDAKVLIECDGMQEHWSGELFNTWLDSGGVARFITEHRTIAWSVTYTPTGQESADLDDQS